MDDWVSACRGLGGRGDDEVGDGVGRHRNRVLGMT